MKNRLLLLILPFIFMTACYNYEGPVRAKRTPPAPRELKVKPSLSAQQYLEKMAGDIERAIPAAQVQILEDSIKVLFPDNIRYTKSSIIPYEDLNSEMKKLARLINMYYKTNVLVTGHTDKSGDEKMNKRLSELRASYIKDLLLANKAPAERINSWGLGSSSPIASELLESGSDKNRRVEFVILADMEEDGGL